MAQNLSIPVGKANTYPLRSRTDAVTTNARVDSFQIGSVGLNDNPCVLEGFTALACPFGRDAFDHFN